MQAPSLPPAYPATTRKSNNWNNLLMMVITAAMLPVVMLIGAPETEPPVEPIRTEQTR